MADGRWQMADGKSNERFHICYVLFAMEDAFLGILLGPSSGSPGRGSLRRTAGV